jgi:hypothetical protein
VTAVFIIAIATWVGAIVFQSAVVAPTVFATVDESQARAFLRALFPRFFRLGLACGAIMTVSIAASAWMSGWTAALSILSGLTAAMLAFEAGSLWLVPHINAARDAGDAGVARFQTLHRLSVLFTVIILLLGIVVLTVIALSTNLSSVS